MDFFNNIGVLFTVEGFFTLMMIILLQAVLGFDNLLYISIESKRAPKDKQAYVRRLGIGMAIVLRIALLFVLLIALDAIKEPFFDIHVKNVVSAKFTLHAFITLGGGAFILYTAIKEIMHLVAIDPKDHDAHQGKTSSTGKVIFWITLMNLVFSFDSILSAMALTDNFWIMAVAIIVSGIMMIVLADHVAEFLQKNRLYEVLGLFILFIVGVLLVSEGAHLAELELFTHVIHPMQKSTFYFVIGVLIVVDLVQGRYQKKLLAKSKRVMGNA